MINTIDIACIVHLVTAKCKIMGLKSGDDLKERGRFYFLNIRRRRK
jgi:hypothetical protein